MAHAAPFMSMRWLRLHIKEIIWATVILFVLSCFIIGYGSSRAQKRMDERRHRAEADERRAQEAEESLPPNLAAKASTPVLQVFYPADATASRVIDAKTLYRSLIKSPEYKQLLQFPPQMRASFGGQIKESIIEGMVDTLLLERYAELNNIQPRVPASQIVKQEEAQLTTPEFSRQLQKAGLTRTEYQARKHQELVMREIFESQTKAMPASAATDAALEAYYNQNRIRFKKDDEISFEHILFSPHGFLSKVSVSDDEIAEYHKVHCNEYQTSKRLSVSHIYINPDDPEYQKQFIIDEPAIRQYYTANLDKFKKSEQVRARHILIKPRNTFEKKLDTFTINLRDFRFVPATESKKGEYTFELGISERKSGINLNFKDIVLVTKDGQRFSPDKDSQEKAGAALEFPQSGTPSSGNVYGEVCILLPKDAQPDKLEVRDGKSQHSFDVSGAHDQELAFAAAETELKAIQARITDGADFAKLAAELSEDEGSREKGGDLGLFGHGQMVRPFEEAAFGAKPGSVVGPVRSQFGWHLIKVEENVPARTLSIDEARPEIVSAIRQEQATQKAVSDLELCTDLLKQGTRTFAQLAEKYSTGESRKNGGKLPIFWKGEFTEDYTDADRRILEAEIGRGNRIDPQIEELLFGMKVKDVSSVLKTENGYHLFQLDSVLDPAQLSFTPSLKTRIRRLLEEKKAKEMALAEARKIAGDLNPTNFTELAKKTIGEEPVKLGPLPFSLDAGFSSYGMTGAIGQVSADGRTYLPAIQKALAEFVNKHRQKFTGTTVPAAGAPAEASKGLPSTIDPKDALIGPIETELGVHFLKLTYVGIDMYEPFAEIKEDLRAMLTQIPREDEVKAQFEKNRERLDKPATRKIRQMVMSDEASARKAYEELKSGQLFTLVSRAYSIDGASQDSKGVVNEVKKGQLPANIDEKVWELKKGEYTEPLQTSYGWVITEVEEIADAVPAQYDKVADQIRGQLKNQLRSKLAQRFINGLRQQARIVRNSELLAEL